MSSPKSKHAKTVEQWGAAGIDGEKLRANSPDMVLDPGQEAEIEYTVGIAGDYEFHTYPIKDNTATLPSVSDMLSYDPHSFKMASDTTHHVIKFVVRDMHTAESGWYKSNSPEVVDSRLLTIVGWVVNDDGVHTHIASIYDPHTEEYGDGVIVPNANILERFVLA
jgi:hypothetical protein